MKRSFLCMFFGLFLISVSAASWKVNASVNKMKLTMHEELQYTIKVSSDAPIRLDDPDPPVAKGLIFRNMMTRSSSGVSLSGLQRTAQYSREFIYVYIPSKPGIFTIPVQSVSIGSKIHKTPAFNIEVIDAPPGTTAPGPSAPPAPVDPLRWVPDPTEAYRPLGEVMLLSVPDRSSVYLGEPVIVSYYLYSTQSLGSFQLEDEEDFSGYGKSVYHQPSQLDYSRATYNGRSYLRALIKQLSVVPNSVGRIQVPGLTGSARVYDYGYQSRSLRSSDSFIQVLALPQSGAPPSFTGAVGRFSVTQQVSPKTLSLGDAVSYKLIVQGRGNFHQFTALSMPENQDFRASKPVITDAVNGGVDGTRTIVYTLLPQRSGELRLPEFRFSWFDSSSGVYRSFEAPKTTITVKPANVLSYFSDLLSREDPQELRALRPLKVYRNYHLYLFSLWFWLLISLILAAVGFSAFLAWENSLRFKDPVRFSRIRAERVLNRYFKEARQAAESLLPEFYVLAEQGLMAYMAEKFKLSNRLSTPEKLEQLANFEIPAEEIGRLSEFITRCGQARFMPGGADASALSQDLQTLQEIVRAFNSLERGAKKS